MHTIPMSYVRAANIDAGGHFFDDENMTFSDSRIESKTAFYNAETGQAFFVTSERLYPGAPRSYKVRRFDDDGRVRTVSPKSLTSCDDATMLAETLAATPAATSVH